jgi:hypothetical protein
MGMSWVGIANSGELFYSTGGNDLVAYGEIAGDVSGIIGATSVNALRGEPISPLAPASGDVLQYDGSQWLIKPISNIDLDDHALLNGARHTDTEAHAPTRGDIIVAGTGNTWDGLSLGTAEFVLYSDGTDALYTRLGQNTPFEDGAVGAPSVTFDGDHFTGAYLSSSGVMGLVAGTDELLTLDGGNTQVTIDAGQVVQTTIGGSTTLTSADYVYLVNAVPSTVTLPAAPTTGQVHMIKDTTGNASNANPITVAGNGNNIDGNASIEIRRNYGSFTLIYNGTEWNII